MTHDDFDENRELCPDGNCLGIVVDGVCNVCGGPKGQDVGQAGRQAAARHGFEASDEADPAFDDDRQLCPDGTCIGVLGSDGKCRECGRLADAQVSS
jgi:hypothetical protein